MIYLYAYTNFKDGLDSLRRVKVIYEFLTQKGKECEILVNDYRAQLTARDWGLPLATTIETIKDIDAVAGQEDTIIIDSPEPIEGKVLSYPSKFSRVIYLNSKCENVEFNGAETVDVYSLNSLIYPNLNIDAKRDNGLFIYGDSDYEKIILNNLSIFEGKNLDFYLGTYFFVKYEDKLASVFNSFVESEEYYSAIQEYPYIVTSSIQVAIDIARNGGKIVFLELKELNKCQKKFLDEHNISIVKDLSLDIIKINDNKSNNISNLNIIFTNM